MSRANDTTTPVHVTGFCTSDDEYRQLVSGFVAAGISAGQPTFLALPREHLALVEQDLGSLEGRVEAADMRQVGRNPGRILAALRRFADAHPDQHVRLVGEPAWAGRSRTEYLAVAEHEALVDIGLAGRRATALCPYAVPGLPQHVLDAARATHPLVWERGEVHENDEYAPQPVLERSRRLLPAPDDAVDCVVDTAAQLSAARRLTSRAALGLGLPVGRLGDLEFVVTELASNSLVHAQGPARVQLWRHEDAVVCTVSDDGVVTDPLVGRHLPDPRQRGGRGLQIVHELADLVRLCPGPQGTTVQVHLAL